jgi:hypothetical protein
VLYSLYNTGDIKKTLLIITLEVLNIFFMNGKLREMLNLLKKTANVLNEISPNFINGGGLLLTGVGLELGVRVARKQEIQESINNDRATLADYEKYMREEIRSDMRCFNDFKEKKTLISHKIYLFLFLRSFISC